MSTPEHDNLPAEPPEKDPPSEMRVTEEAQVAEREEPPLPAPLTKRQRLWQIILGWLAGFLIWFCMALGLMHPDNQLLSWSFLIVFAAAMFGRNAVEHRTGMDLRLYMRCFLYSLIVFLAVFVVLGPVTHLLPGS